MTCYVLQAGTTDRAKIGWAARDVEARVAALQAGCWEPLRIARTMPGCRLVESWLHHHFQSQRIARDWFVFDATMLTIVPPPMPVPPPANALPDCDLLREIDAFLATARMTPTMFGVRSVNDPRLVHDMRLGRECKRAIRRRIRTFIAAASVPSVEAA